MHPATAAWAALSAAAAGFVLAFGVNFPFMDEWATIDALDGRQPLGPWLWEWHNEHLLPLPRLVFWGLYQLTGDLRAGMLASVAGWAVLARGLMLAARRLRGRAALADAFFPLVLLHWGHAENFLMAYQLGFMLSTGLAGAGLILMLDPRPRRVAAVAGVAAALPFCGAHGAVFAAAFGVWVVAILAVWHGRLARPCEAHTGRQAASATPAETLVALPLLAVAAWGVSLYVTDRPPTPGWVPQPTAAKFATGAVGYEAMGFGPVGKWLWPASAALPAAVGVVVLFGLRGRYDRARLGVLAFLGAAVLLAVVVGWARGRYGLFAVFFPRYAVLAALIPVGAFFLCLTSGRPRLAAAGPAGLAAAALLALPANAWLGWEEGRQQSDTLRGAEAELRAGVPPAEIAGRYHFRIFNNAEFLAGALARYAGHRAGADVRSTAATGTPPGRPRP